MSTVTSNFDRQLICATCLSQDRKLIAITDSQACLFAYLELSLVLSDMTCWECHSLVRRMARFKSKAQKAQAYLWNMTNGLQQELPSLSLLTSSSGVSVDIPPDPTIASTDIKTEPPEPIEVTIKQEIEEDELITKNVYRSLPDAATSYRQQSRGVPMPARVTVTADTVPTLMTRDDNDDNIIENEHGGEDVEMSVLTHVIAPEESKTNQRTNTAANTQVQIISPGSSQIIYTEELLTEEQMVQWRQTKARTEYFLRSIPSERCEMCLEIFDHARLAAVHAKRHTDNYGDIECTICHQRVIDERAMAAHRTRHYRLLSCRFCPFVWDNANTLRHHCSEIHNVPQVVWDCDHCERQFPSYKLLRMHGNSHKYVKCRVCRKHVTEPVIRKHMLLHEGGLPLKTCEVCGKQCRGAGGLRSHKLTHITEVEINESLYCVKCSLQCRNRFQYRRHMQCGKHAAKEDYRFECDHCGRKFLNLGLLRRHMNMHNGTQYPCQLCPKVYNTKTGIRTHTKNVHEGKTKERDYVCDYCGKAFTIRKTLLEHINSHKGARPYACEICGDTFGYKSALYLHGRFKHKIQKKNQYAKKIGDAKKTDKSK